MGLYRILGTLLDSMRCYGNICDGNKRVNEDGSAENRTTLSRSSGYFNPNFEIDAKLANTKIGANFWSLKFQSCPNFFDFPTINQSNLSFYELPSNK